MLLSEVASCNIRGNVNRFFKSPTPSGWYTQGRYFTRTLGGKAIGITLTKNGATSSLSPSSSSFYLFRFFSFPFPLFSFHATHIQLSSLGSAVSSPSGVWGEATVDIEFGAIWQSNLASGQSDFCDKLYLWYMIYYPSLAHWRHESGSHHYHFDGR